MNDMMIYYSFESCIQLKYLFEAAKDVRLEQRDYRVQDPINGLAVSEMR